MHHRQRSLLLVIASLILCVFATHGFAAPAPAPVPAPVTAEAPPPAECTFRFALESGTTVLAAKQADQKDPLLQVGFRRMPGNQLAFSTTSSGKPMATVAIQQRTWTLRNSVNGAGAYGWRYDRTRNMWDDRDRAEIGSDYSILAPFNSKTFVVRMVITTTTRQLWIDDRLIAEDRSPVGGGAVTFTCTKPDAQLSVREQKSFGRFAPLRMDDYESDGRALPESDVKPVGPDNVPIRALASGARDLDLGKSLWRYRLTHGTGPEAPYVNALSAWPTPLQVDPATAAFRVPYREYQTAWLVVYLDEKAGSVPRGSVAFFRDHAGFVAQTDFEITPDAIDKKLVTPLGKNSQGKTQYLVRVPLDDQGLYGMKDLSDQFIDFQITKPMHLVRSYPDPIYYSRHPGGEPSSVRVTSITLEESPFSFTVKPAQFGHVFEQPGAIAYKIDVANLGPDTARAKVKLETVSYDESEKTAATGESAPLEPGKSAEVPLTLNLKTLGWHSLKATVTAGNVTKKVELSLVLLPPNRRTYGDADNETRFGAWCLLGHYMPLSLKQLENEPIMKMLRSLGIRRLAFHGSFINAEQARSLNFLPVGPHTNNSVYHRLNVNDEEAMKKMVVDEVAEMQTHTKSWPAVKYYYGGEWGFDHTYSHTTNPLYTGQGPYVFSAESQARLDRQIKIFKAVGEALREKTPQGKLVLQWGSPLHEVAFMDAGFPKNLVDEFGMDAPMFELLPETPVSVGSINYLWVVRAEAKRLGWPRLPISWCEGPFMPAFEGAMSERTQEENHVRYWLLGLAYGIEAFEAAMVPFDTANYYGAEHYGAGVFRRIPYTCPKPAVAALATATAMVCGMDVVGPVDTGTTNNYCLALKQAKTGAMTYALWRVAGTADAALAVTGDPVVTNAMGNAKKAEIKDGKITLKISQSPVWLTGAANLKVVSISAPKYEEKPASITHALAAFSSDRWTFKNDAELSYEKNHFGLTRVTDTNLSVTFKDKDDDKSGVAHVTLAKEPAGDRPLAIRYGQLVLKHPAAIPGKASALGLWVHGNAGWGRIAYEVRDAKGELWTSIGTPNDWNCDDPYGWSRVCFDGWRYLRFPLPGNRPYDAARELESTWWKSEKGDGIVDLPLSLTRIFVEATNETLVLGELRPIENRTYKLAGLVAEYADQGQTKQDVIAKHQYREVPAWTGPQENPLAKLAETGVGDAPTIKGFEEPGHWNDGRQMVLRVDAKPDVKYCLYLSRYPDGRGAEKIGAAYTDKSNVTGLRPGITMYLFMTATGADGKESKPSAGYKLVTEDKFAEK